jgi:hypothetical protein
LFEEERDEEVNQFSVFCWRGDAAGGQLAAVKGMELSSTTALPARLGCEEIRPMHQLVIRYHHVEVKLSIRSRGCVDQVFIPD